MDNEDSEDSDTKEKIEFSIKEFTSVFQEGSNNLQFTEHEREKKDGGIRIQRSQTSLVY